jgi:hypothetical protein
MTIKVSISSERSAWEEWSTEAISHNTSGNHCASLSREGIVNVPWELEPLSGSEHMWGLVGGR